MIIMPGEVRQRTYKSFPYAHGARLRLHRQKHLTWTDKSNHYNPSHLPPAYYIYAVVSPLFHLSPIAWRVQEVCQESRPNYSLMKTASRKSFHEHQYQNKRVYKDRRVNPYQYSNTKAVLFLNPIIFFPKRVLFFQNNDDLM